MTFDLAPGTASGLVVCVGLPPDQIIEIAQLLRGRATVLATPDAEGARAVLDSSARPVAAEAGAQPAARWTDAGPPAVAPVPDHPGELVGPDDLTGVGLRPPLELVRGRHTGGFPPPGDDAAVTGRGRFRPGGGPPAPAGPPRRPATGAPPSSVVRPATGALPAVTGPVPMVAPPTPEPLVAGPLLVDLSAREVTARGRRVYLSAREFDLLATLALEAGRVWSFAELTARVWQLPYLGDSDPVTSAVKRLRKRLAPVREVEVESVRGVGYRLRIAR
ncbi:MAG TPA: winged helix-turn-helix domain-containing protein [Promicromonospora sp.]|nr:winged helix-turn-helix domain-containing protein [Promicromonospora sp.]